MQMQLPQMGKINKILVISLISGFLLAFIAGVAKIPLMTYLGLSAQGFFSGHIYQLATFSFFPQGLLSVLFEGLILWFIGSELEDIWGGKRYLQFLGSALLGGAVVFLLISAVFFKGSILYAYPISGPGGICSALCVAYGVLFPDRQMYLYLFPVKAKWFVIILIAINLYQGISSPNGVLAWHQLGAMGAGYVWMYLISHPVFKDWVRQKDKEKIKKKRSHLRVVEDDDDDITYH